MPSQRIRVHMKVPMDPRALPQLLEDEGFVVEEVTEIRGSVLASVDIVSFIVENIDDVLIPVLASVVGRLISRRSASRPIGDRGVNFTVQDSSETIVVNVTGDGNWVQIHPRPEQTDGRRQASEVGDGIQSSEEE